MSKRTLPQEHVKIIRKHFDKFDKDKSGSIDKDELRQVLEATLNLSLPDNVFAKYVETEMAKYDKNGDGVLQFDEYVVLFSKYVLKTKLHT